MNKQKEEQTEQTEQKDNTVKKKARKQNAQELPEGITHNMMKKYVYYCQEYYDKEQTKKREFFRVEKHPKLKKSWSTTKSTKVTIMEKLAQANKMVEDLDKIDEETLENNLKV
jgi:hypothetical protein